MDQNYKMVTNVTVSCEAQLAVKLGYVYARQCVRVTGRARLSFKFPLAVPLIPHLTYACGAFGSGLDFCGYDQPDISFCMLSTGSDFRSLSTGTPRRIHSRHYLFGCLASNTFGT